MSSAENLPASTGDCYEAAALYMLDNLDKPHLWLVHGEVAGQGPLAGVTLGHAWVEDGGTVIDRSKGRNIHIPKWQYYKIGNVLGINNIHRYSATAMCERILAHGHYGPWELETEH